MLYQEFYFDNYQGKNMGRYINHSGVHPNIIPRVYYWEDDVPELIFKASVDLKPGTQIVFDYGHDHQTTKKFVATCVLCNEENTRHNIRLHEDPEHDDVSAEGRGSQDASDPYEFRDEGEVDEDGNAKASAEDEG